MVAKSHITTKCHACLHVLVLASRIVIAHFSLYFHAANIDINIFLRRFLFRGFLNVTAYTKFCSQFSLVKLELT